MRLPRDLSGKELGALLARYGYTPTRQTGSHLRLTTQRNGEHHVTVPLHDPLKLGTLSAVIDQVAQHLQLPRQSIAEALFK